MNILESQVSDLTNIAGSPIAIPVYTMNGQQRQSSSAESPARPDSSKRKSDDTQNGASHTRAKRNRYISIACNECKRRKIKCNGNTPCQRCGNLNLECQYAPNCCSNGFKDSEEFKHMNAQIQSLQEQVDNLYANLNALRVQEPLPHMALAQQSVDRSMSMSQQSMTDSSPTSRYRSHPKHRFQGPTSSAFSIDVAKNTLHNMGYPGLSENEGEGVNTQDDTPLGSPPPRPAHLSTISNSRDPLWQITKDEAVRLCRVYEEEMGLMYPVLNIETMIQHATNLYRYLDAAVKNVLVSDQTRLEGIKDENSKLLKMVLAVALTVEGSGQSELGNKLFDSVKGAADDLMRSESVDLGGLPLLSLVAIYHFHCDEETLAWRMIGQVARMCIELGLHRRDALFKIITDPEERAGAIRLFWSVYVLDRRWSFGTGLPFAIQDADVDPTLPEPEVAIPYLNVMIAYSRLGSRVWRSVAGFESASAPDIKKEDIGYLDYQISQWQKSIPPELQLPTANSPEPSSRAIHRLQILLYLRCNQMRILMYRPVLHSANSIMENLPYAHTVVELAKDTIRALTHLNQTTDIYRVQQVCFNYFLISALAVIFLASCHAPVQFSNICREEFYMALDLVKGFSSRSYISKRLWRTIRGLKEVGPKLGLSEDQLSRDMSGVEDPHSSAALAMAGLAGHEISGMGNFMGGQQDRAGTATSPMNGFQMSHEMTSLFEAALGNNTAINGSAHGYPSTGLQDGIQNEGLGVGTAIGGANAFGGEEELYRQMRELF